MLGLITSHDVCFFVTCTYCLCTWWLVFMSEKKGIYPNVVDPLIIFNFKVTNHIVMMHQMLVNIMYNLKLWLYLIVIAFSYKSRWGWWWWHIRCVMCVLIWRLLNFKFLTLTGSVHNIFGQNILFSNAPLHLGVNG